MKILILGFPTMGGSGMITLQSGLELAKRGHDIHFLFYKRPFFLKDSDKVDNITFHLIERTSYALFKDIDSPFTIQTASKIAEIVREHKIDIVHSHYAIPHVVSTYLADLMQPVKTIVTTHGSDVHTLGPLPEYKETVSMAMRNTNSICSVSDYLSRETENVFGLEPNTTHTIHDFIDTQQFSPLNVKKEKVLIQASNFRSVKQLPLLIELYAKIAPNFPDWTLNLIGDGPETTLTLRKARTLGIKSQVKFMGINRNLPEAFAKASILTSSSSTESFGLTIGEAMSCGTPIWAPKVGGIPELCDDGVTGYLYDFDDKDRAVELLAKMMEDEDLRLKMGQKAREKIINQFSVDKIIKKYETHYQNVLNDN